MIFLNGRILTPGEARLDPAWGEQRREAVRTAIERSSRGHAAHTRDAVQQAPDGYAHNLQDGIIRARFRTSAAEPSLIRPGRIYKYEIDLWATSHVLFAGHRLRLEISSSNFPRFDRNPNTGAPIGVDARLETALQTVVHTADYPSHVTLPVIPR